MRVTLSRLALILFVVSYQVGWYGSHTRLLLEHDHACIRLLDNVEILQHDMIMRAVEKVVEADGTRVGEGVEALEAARHAKAPVDHHEIDLAPLLSRHAIDRIAVSHSLLLGAAWSGCSPRALSRVHFLKEVREPRTICALLRNVSVPCGIAFQRIDVSNVRKGVRKHGGTTGSILKIDGGAAKILGKDGFVDRL